MDSQWEFHFTVYQLNSLHFGRSFIRMQRGSTVHRLGRVEHYEKGVAHDGPARAEYVRAGAEWAVAWNFDSQISLWSSPVSIHISPCVVHRQWTALHLLWFSEKSSAVKSLFLTESPHCPEVSMEGTRDWKNRVVATFCAATLTHSGFAEQKNMSDWTSWSRFDLRRGHLWSSCAWPAEIRLWLLSDSAAARETAVIPLLLARTLAHRPFLIKSFDGFF